MNQQPNSGWTPEQGAPQQAPQPQPQAQYTAQQQPQQPQPQQAYVQYQQESPLSAAWNDIKNTDGWIPNILIKALVFLVPILNFCTYGFAGKWATDAAKGIRQPMTKQSVSGDFFVAGLLYCVIGLIVGIVLGLANLIPFIGALVVFAATFVILIPLCYLMYIRYLSYGNFGAAFQLGDIFNKMKRNFGKLWVACYVPGLICGCIGGIATAFLIMIMAFVGIGTASSAYIGGMGDAGIFALITSMGLFFIIAMLPLFLMSSFSVIWSLRAVGIWCQQNVPEWAAALPYQPQVAQQQPYAQQNQQYAQQQQVYQQPAPTYQQAQQPTQPQAQYPIAQQPQPPAQHPTYTPYPQEGYADPTPPQNGNIAPTQFPPQQ